MKLHELLSKITDSYHQIVINEYKGDVHTGRVWNIPPHNQFMYLDIPDGFKDKEVLMIIPYYDSLHITIASN